MHLVKARISCKITQCKLSKRDFLGGLVADNLGTIENGAHSLLIVGVENDYYAAKKLLAKYMYLLCELRCWRLSARWLEQITHVIKNVELEIYVLLRKDEKKTRSLTVHEPQIDSNYSRIRQNTLEKMYLLSMQFSKRQGTGPPVVDSGSTSNPPVFINQHGEYERLNVTTGTTDTAGDRKFTTHDSIEMESHSPSLELQKVYGLVSVADNQKIE
ncbi:hypothetical protein G5I_14579 [Acromyrmex echinatior]|uniref:Uncharacterized protein n=1 Tax=Acromyrmex echinatior TaxID=103372 RepID=F4X842_ACREC|nr:hypothetical protein G5I_14579 [Acromyrmex echinatior]